MVVREGATPGATRAPAPTPEAFRRAVEGMRAARLRPEVACEEMPAPGRIAPYAAALTADVSMGGSEIGTGRIIVLHDPAGNDAWGGTFRCVAYARADIEPEAVAEEILAEVGWSWLVEALDAHDAAYRAPSGTVTVVATTSFGAMADEGRTAQVEVRASWTPVTDEDGGFDAIGHVEAWGELVCTAAGLEPIPDGVTPIPQRRGQRGHRPS
ncbi:MAG: DUF3000 domain-containing protein [Nocardioides sp.]